MDVSESKPYEKMQYIGFFWGCIAHVDALALQFSVCHFRPASHYSDLEVQILLIICGVVRNVPVIKYPGQFDSRTPPYIVI